MIGQQPESRSGVHKIVSSRSKAGRQAAQYAGFDAAFLKLAFGTGIPDNAAADAIFAARGQAG